MPTRRRLLESAAAAAALSFTRLALPQDSAPPPTSAKLPPAVAALPLRSHEAVPITLAERESRLERARSLMHTHHLDALVLCTGASLFYFTGLEWEQSERFFAWVLPAASAPFLVCPAFEEARVRERMDSRPATLPAAAHTRVYTWNEDDSPYSLLAHALRDAGLSTATLGIDERTQFVFADGIAHASPTLTLASGTPISAGCRMHKSPAELALMQLANTITLSVYEAVYKSLSPGMTNHEVTDLIALAYTRSGVSGEASCEVGANSAIPHGTLQPQTIREHEIILLDDGCTVEGYQSDISRAFVLGSPTDKQKKVFDIVHHAQAAALAAARPGLPCGAIDDAARAVLTAAGYGPGYKYLTHRLGHGIGLEGHEWPYLVRGNPLPLAPGMCFSDEPGIYLPGPTGDPDAFGIRLEDDWYMTESGGRLFTPQSPSLEHPFARA